jgi:urea carboxylase
VVCRVAGDHFLLVELGPLELDIARRFRVHALMLALQANKPEGIRELTPGIRSLQIHYDAQQISLQRVTEWIEQTLTHLDSQETLSVPSRVVHLPLSWDDQACQLAIDKYMQSVRPGAPWCPSNIEFIRRINGLESIEEVKKTVFDASYLVLGLGDVYLGAPVATPIDPRHRLVTTKYNPARTWTAENSVGIGGAYMCVYGMEGPGGYQFVGRTSQMWNRYRSTDAFMQPWLLRFFDQIKFYPVTQSELVDIRKKLPLGQHELIIEETEFHLEQYLAFLEENQSSIRDFQVSRSEAFQHELHQWKVNGQLTYEQTEVSLSDNRELAVPENVTLSDSPVSGNVWQVTTEVGQHVNAGDVLMVLESMKMEIEVQSIVSGVVTNVLVNEGHSVESGQPLVWIEES